MRLHFPAAVPVAVDDVVDDHDAADDEVAVSMRFLHILAAQRIYLHSQPFILQSHTPRWSSTLAPAWPARCGAAVRDVRSVIHFGL